VCPFETGVIVYDTLFLVLAEDADTLVVTADGKLLEALEDAPCAHLGHPLTDAGSLLPSTELGTRSVLQPG